MSTTTTKGNGKILIIAPGESAKLIDHEGAVRLEDLHRHLEVDCVDVRQLGKMPVDQRRSADLWFDDEGLLKNDWTDDNGVAHRGNLPNRRIGSDTVIFGRMLICASDQGGESWPLTEQEAAVCLHLVNAKWAQLPADFPRPEPQVSITDWPEGP
jgi:hypothetical protein